MTKQIFTMTPNPALDLGGSTADLKPNEKSYVFQPTIHPGGNSINAARLLKRLGFPVVATGFLGGGTGEEIRSLLDQEGVKNNFIQILGHSRISVTISNQKDHQQTRLTFPGPFIRNSEKKKLTQFLTTQKNISYLVIGGSLPPGFSPRDVAHLIKAAHKMGIQTIVDCPGNILRQLIPSRPLLIKPNLLEFQDLIGHKVRSIKAVSMSAANMLNKIPMICVSSVEGGALLITKSGFYFGKIPSSVKVKSTVGAGDSMLAAMVGQLHKKNSSNEDILRWGLAAAAATLQESGTALGVGKEIRKIYKQIIIRTVFCKKKEKSP